MSGQHSGYINTFALFESASMQEKLKAGFFYVLQIMIWNRKCMERICFNLGNMHFLLAILDNFWR